MISIIRGADLVGQVVMPAAADKNVCPTDEVGEKTLEGNLDTEALPVHWSWLMRFTLLPPHDNVIVANESWGRPLSSTRPLPQPQHDSGRG